MIKISSVEGNKQWLDGGSMFGNAPRAIWEKWTEVDERDRIPLACRCLLIEWNNLKILCEAGIGAFFEPKLADRFGVQDKESHELVKNLESLGHALDDIDFVILSHLHFDHIGGLLPTYREIQQSGEKLIFKKAKFIVGEKAWQRAQKPHPRDRASFVPELNQLLKNSGRLIIVKNGEVPDELTGIIDFFETDGHTPGQMHTLVKGDTGSIVYAGDLIPGSAWVHLPITMGYDRFPEKLIEEKEALYKSFSEKNLKIFFTHDPIYAMGELEKNEKGKYQVKNRIESFSQLEL